MFQSYLSRWLKFNKSFYSFKFLDKKILGSHSISSKCEAHSDSGKKTFWNICNNDTNQKDYRIEPIVAKNKCNNGEGNSKKDSNTVDDVNEVSNLFGNGCVFSIKIRWRPAILPITVLSPILTSMLTRVPSIELVVKNPIFRVFQWIFTSKFRRFNLSSDSPVSEKLSTLKPFASKILNNSLH